MSDSIVSLCFSELDDNPETKTLLSSLTRGVINSYHDMKNLEVIDEKVADMIAKDMLTSYKNNVTFLNSCAYKPNIFNTEFISRFAAMFSKPEDGFHTEIPMVTKTSPIQITVSDIRNMWVKFRTSHEIGMTHPYTGDNYDYKSEYDGIYSQLLEHFISFYQHPIGAIIFEVGGQHLCLLKMVVSTMILIIGPDEQTPSTLVNIYQYLF